MADLTVTEQKVLEYARQWARCVLHGACVGEEGYMSLFCGNDAAMHAESFMQRLQSEAKNLIFEKCADRTEDGKKFLP
jgi:hypothetical protein